MWNSAPGMFSGIAAPWLLHAQVSVMPRRKSARASQLSIPTFGARSSSVLNLRSVHPLELACVRSDHHQSPCRPDCGNQNIVSADWPPSGVECSADCRRGLGVGCIERQPSDERKESTQHSRPPRMDGDRGQERAPPRSPPGNGLVLGRLQPEAQAPGWWRRRRRGRGSLVAGYLLGGCLSAFTVAPVKNSPT